MCCIIFFVLLCTIICILTYINNERRKKEIELFNSQNIPRYTLDAYMIHGHETVPPITGDYFKLKRCGEEKCVREHLLSNSVYSITYYKCAHECSQICSNCLRRRETYSNGELYYGSSEKCYTEHDNEFDYD